MKFDVKTLKFSRKAVVYLQRVSYLGLFCRVVYSIELKNDENISNNCHWKFFIYSNQKKNYYDFKELMEDLKFK